jgi:hypothetical protein
MSTGADKKRHLAITVAVLMLSVACSDRSAATLDDVAEQYVRLALELAQHDPSLVESWRGPNAWRPTARRPVAVVADQIAAADASLQLAAYDAGSAFDNARSRYLQAQLRALRFAASRLGGRSTTIDEQMREEFALTLPPLDPATVTSMHNGVRAWLPGESTLAERVRNLRTATIIPTDRRQPVVQLALNACRTATRASVAMPDDESVQVLFRPNTEWDGYARYLGNNRSEIELSDTPLDISRAFHLACHEAYPGHHVQFVLLDRFSREHGWPELQLAPGFGRHLLLAEGAAELGADLAMPRDARIALYRDHLLPAAGLDPRYAAALVTVEDVLDELLVVVADVARKYLDGALSRDAALARLENDALVTNPAGTLAFIERRRARALVYGEGRRALQRLMQTPDLAGLYGAFSRAAALQ